MILDRSKPFAQTYGPAAAQGMAFFQDGLYFKANGELNEMLPANLEVLKARSASMQAAAPAAVPAKDELDKKSNADLFKMAQSILDIQTEAGEPLDYVPTLDKRAGNLAFIRLHTE